MILNRLILRNFKRYADFTYDFEDGLTGIVGRNGAGKSTIFDAVYFGLYGDVRYLGDKDSIKTTGAESKDPVAVVLEFEIDGSNYRVQREFRGKALTAQASFYDSQDQQLAFGAKDVNQAVAKCLGMSKDAFLSTVFASQKELTFLSTMHHEDRKKMIRKLLGLEKIDAVETLAREQITDLNRDMKAQQLTVLSDDDEKMLQDRQEALKQSVVTVTDELKTFAVAEAKLQEQIKASKQQLKEQAELKDKKGKADNRIKQIESDLTHSKANLITAQKRLKELKVLEEKWQLAVTVKADIQKVEKDLEKQQQLKSDQNTLAELLKSQTDMEKDIASLMADMEKLETDLKQLEPQKILLKQIDDQLKQLKEKLDAVNEKGQREKEIIATQEQLLKVAKGKKEKIETLGKDSPCPVCTRPLAEQYGAVVSDLDAEITGIAQKTMAEAVKRRETCVEEYRLIDTDLKKQQAEKEKIQKLINDMENKQVTVNRYKDQLEGLLKRKTEGVERIEGLKKTPYDEKAHQQLIGQHQELKPKYEEWLRLDGLIKDIPTVDKEISVLGETIGKLNTNLKTATSEFDSIIYDSKVHEEIQKADEALVEQKDVLAGDISQKKVQQAEHQKDMSSVAAEISRNDGFKKKLSGLQESLNDYLKIKESLANFKTMINGKISPRISQVASDLFGRITKGRYQHIEVNSDFDFFIYDGGAAYPIDRFSGGEIDLANLVLRIAISKTLGELSGGTKVEFLAFDEIFGSQDEDRRQEIMNAFQLISEQYRQIFLITHEAEIKEQFPRVIEL